MSVFGETNSGGCHVDRGAERVGHAGQDHAGCGTGQTLYALTGQVQSRDRDETTIDHSSQRGSRYPARVPTNSTAQLGDKSAVTSHASRVLHKGAATPSDWHGGEESPVNNSPERATSSRKPTVRVRVYRAREAHRPATYGQLVTAGETATNHHSPADLLPSKAIPAAGALLLPALAATLFTWERWQAVFLICDPAFAITRDRRAFPGAATGVGHLTFRAVLHRSGSRNQQRSQSLTILLRLLGFGFASRKATGDRRAPLYPCTPVTPSSPKEVLISCGSPSRSLCNPRFKHLQEPARGLCISFEVLSPLAIHAPKDSERKRQSVVIQ